MLTVDTQICLKLTLQRHLETVWNEGRHDSAKTIRPETGLTQSRRGERKKKKKAEVQEGRRRTLPDEINVWSLVGHQLEYTPLYKKKIKNEASWCREKQWNDGLLSRLFA